MHRNTIVSIEHEANTFARFGFVFNLLLFPLEVLEFFSKRFSYSQFVSFSISLDTLVPLSSYAI